MSGPLAAVRGAEENLVRPGDGNASAAAGAVSKVADAHNALFGGGTAAGQPHAVVPRAITRSASGDCVLLIDNYDSFTYNVYQVLARTGRNVVVARNDQITVPECQALRPTHVVLSPGPCSPSEAGVCADVLRAFQGVVPVLGVCLGMEVMVEVYGSKIDVCSEIKHGKTSSILHDGLGVFAGVTQGVHVVRYHSLAAFPDHLRDHAPDLMVTSVSEHSGIIMGVRHRRYTVEGVQFHPESIKTDQGVRMVMLVCCCCCCCCESRL
jgi:anthranilate synthase / indole-3-glycerol phosphate synthase